MLQMMIIIGFVFLIFLLFTYVDFKSRRKEVKSIHSYISRIILSTLFFISGAVLIVCFREYIFYLDQRNGLLFDSANQLNDWPRFIWCGGFALMGFGFTAYQSRFSQKLPYFPYFFYYPFSLMLITCLGYSILSVNSSTRGHVFYPLSLAFCGTLGVLVDRYWDLAKDLFRK